MKFAMTLAATVIGLAVSVQAAWADKLDDIIGSGVLRCAVVLDFPPMGSRDEKNQPIGFDVDTCNDLAAALGIEHRAVENDAALRRDPENPCVAGGGIGIVAEKQCRGGHERLNM